MNNLIISLKDEDDESQQVQDFITKMAKTIAKALNIPYDLVMKNYGKEKEKSKKASRKKGNWKR